MEHLQPQLQTVLDLRDMPGEGVYAVSGISVRTGIPISYRGESQRGLV